MVLRRALGTFPLLLATLLLRRTDSSPRSDTWQRALSSPPQHHGHALKPLPGLRTDLADSDVTNVTAQLGTAAFLPCRPPWRPELPAEVSWLRRRDWHLLATGKSVFISDERFHVFHDPVSAVWVLKISFVQLEDSGLYECQVATRTGALSRLVRLRVVRPLVSIHGTSAYHVERGSSIRLVCSVRQQEPSWPVMVSWHHNATALNPYKLREDVKISGRRKDGGRVTTSTLVIGDARRDDSGRYSCSADGARAASVVVYVSQGDKMAAIQRWKGVSESAEPASVASAQARACPAVSVALLTTLAATPVLRGFLR